MSDHLKVPIKTVLHSNVISTVLPVLYRWPAVEDHFTKVSDI